MEAILDMICAEYGSRVTAQSEPGTEGNKVESTITKSLGILQEDGFYAFALYARSKKDGASAEARTMLAIWNTVRDFLADPRVDLIPLNTPDLLEGIQDMFGDIDRLGLGKDLTERMLVYARYHAKAL